MNSGKKSNSLLRYIIPWITPTVVLVAATGIVVWQSRGYGNDPRGWDVLAASGWLTFAIGASLARGIPSDMKNSLTASHTTGVIPRPDPPGRVAKMVRWTAAIIGAVATAVLIHLVWEHAKPGDPLTFLIPVDAAGAVVGIYLGLMIAFGIQLASIVSHGLTIERSGVANARASVSDVGAFYVRVLALLAIPGLFLLVWAIVIAADTHQYGTYYGNWIAPYLLLLAVVLAVAALAVGAPWFVIASKLGQERYRLRTELLAQPNSDTRTEQLAELETISLFLLWRPRAPERLALGLVGALSSLPAIQLVVSSATGFKL